MNMQNEGQAAAAASGGPRGWLAANGGNAATVATVIVAAAPIIDALDRVGARLDNVETALDRVAADLNRISTDLDRISTGLERFLACLERRRAADAGIGTSFAGFEVTREQPRTARCAEEAAREPRRRQGLGARAFPQAAALAGAARLSLPPGAFAQVETGGRQRPRSRAVRALRAIGAAEPSRTVDMRRAARHDRGAIVAWRKEKRR